MKFSIKPFGDPTSEPPRPSFRSRPEIGSHCFVSHTTYIFLRTFRIRLIPWSGQFTWNVSLRWNQCCCGTAAMCLANTYTLKTKTRICMCWGLGGELMYAISASVSHQRMRASVQSIAPFQDGWIPFYLLLLTNTASIAPPYLHKQSATRQPHTVSIVSNWPSWPHTHKQQLRR
jgi:hypothetical protein